MRELENEIRRAVALAEEGELIGSGMLSEKVRAKGEDVVRFVERKGDLRGIVEQVECTLIERALAEHGGNKSKAAEQLGLTRKGLRNKMARHGM